MVFFGSLVFPSMALSTLYGSVTRFRNRSSPSRFQCFSVLCFGGQTRKLDLVRGGQTCPWKRLLENFDESLKFSGLVATGLYIYIFIIIIIIFNYWSRWWKKASHPGESEKFEIKVELTVKYLKFLNFSVHMNIDFNEAA